MNAEGLIDRIAELRRSVSGHKKAIKSCREQLARDAGELAVLEDRCRELGIGLTYTSRTDVPSQA